jgi:hypothetical protein
LGLPPDSSRGAARISRFVDFVPRWCLAHARAPRPGGDVGGPRERCWSPTVAGLASRRDPRRPGSAAAPPFAGTPMARTLVALRPEGATRVPCRSQRTRTVPLEAALWRGARSNPLVISISTRSAPLCMPPWSRHASSTVWQPFLRALGHACRSPFQPDPMRSRIRHDDAPTHLHQRMLLRYFEAV